MLSRWRGPISALVCPRWNRETSTANAVACERQASTPPATAPQHTTATCARSRPPTGRPTPCTVWNAPGPRYGELPHRGRARLCNARAGGIQSVKMLPGDLARMSLIVCTLRDGPRAWARSVELPGDGLALVVATPGYSEYVFVFFRGLFGWVRDVELRRL